MEYAMGMIGRHATLARLRKSRRLPLTEAAYNGHHEVLQVGFSTHRPIVGRGLSILGIFVFKS